MVVAVGTFSGVVAHQPSMITRQRSHRAGGSSRELPDTLGHPASANFLGAAAEPHHHRCPAGSWLPGESSGGRPVPPAGRPTGPGPRPDFGGHAHASVRHRCTLAPSGDQPTRIADHDAQADRGRHPSDDEHAAAPPPSRQPLVPRPGVRPGKLAKFRATAALQQREGEASPRRPEGGVARTVRA